MRRVVLVGAGHAHLPVIAGGRRFAARNAQLIVVSPPYHDYSGMGPGVLAGRYPLALPRIDIAPLVAATGGVFLSGQVVAVDPQHKSLHLADGTSIPYDVVSFNTGSRIGLPLPPDAVGRSVFPVKPTAWLDAARRVLSAAGGQSRRQRVLVIGGGPAGCEVAGNLQELAQRSDLDLEITLVAGRQLLGRFSPRVRRLATEGLLQRPLYLLEGVHVAEVAAQTVRLSDGRTLAFDVALVASGTLPSGPFAAGTLPLGPQGGLAVDACLHSPSFSEIFAGGDCLDFLPHPLPRVGVHAVRQGELLLHNLLATCSGAPLACYRPQTHFLQIFNLGLGRTLTTGYGLSWRRPSSLRFKEYLDTRFLRRFYTGCTL